MILRNLLPHLRIGLTVAACVLVPTAAAHADAIFVENRGQWPAPVRYALLGGGDRVWVLSDGFLVDRVVDETRCTVRFVIEEAAAEPSVDGLEASTGEHHFFLGNDPADWRTHVPGFRAVAIRGIRPGVDLVLRADRGPFTYDLVFHDGAASVPQVTIRCDGVSGLSVNDDSSLELDTPLGVLRQDAPRAFVMSESGGRQPVTSNVHIVDGRRFAFTVDGASPSGTLVVDPGIEWATYFGGSVFAPTGVPEVPRAVDIATDGAIVFCGYAGLLDFPGVTAGSFHGGGGDGFVSALSPDGANLQFSTYVGGALFEIFYDIDIGANGAIALAGTTTSRNYPTTAGALFASKTGAFTTGMVTVLNPSGDNLQFSTFLGGSHMDTPGAVAICADGSVVTAGVALSADFPITPGAFDPITAAAEGFLARISTDGSTLIYSTFLGGIASDSITDLAVDSAGNATVVGSNASPDFPTTPGSFDPIGANGLIGEAFVARFDPQGQVFYSTKLVGALSGAFATRVVLDEFGRATVLGVAGGFDFPTTPNVWLKQCGFGCTSPFLTRFTLDGSALVWSTLTGPQVSVSDIAIDSRGGVVGAYHVFPSEDYVFPAGAFKPAVTDHDMAIFRFDPQARALFYGTYFGGSQFEGTDPNFRTLALTDTDSAVLVAGTQSTDFPVTPGAFQSQMKGPADAFVAQLDLLPIGVSKYGSATAGCAGKPAIGVTRMPNLGAELAITCGRAPHGAVGFLAVGAQSLATPVSASGAKLWLDPNAPLFFLPVQAGLDGNAEVRGRLSANYFTPGSRFFAQFVFPDACAPGGVAASNALDVTVQP